MQDIKPVPTPSPDDNLDLAVPNKGEPSIQEVVLEGFKATLKTAERVAFVVGLGWFLHQHFDSVLMQEFITPLTVLLNSIALYLLATKEKGDK